MPQRKVAKKTNNVSFVKKINDLKKQIKQLKDQTKKIKQEAYDEAYAKAMSEILREVKKRDAGRTKAILSAEAKFIKDYDSNLAKKAKVKNRTTKPKTKMKKESKEGNVQNLKSLQTVRKEKDSADADKKTRRGRPKKSSESM